MTDTRTAARGGADSGSAKRRKGNALGRFFSGIVLYVRQVIDEMRKVRWPTRTELGNYTLVVLVFLAIVMAYVVGLDQIFKQLVTWLFGTE